MNPAPNFETFIIKVLKQFMYNKRRRGSIHKSNFTILLHVTAPEVKSHITVELKYYNTNTVKAEYHDSQGLYNCNKINLST